MSEIVKGCDNCNSNPKRWLCAIDVIKKQLKKQNKTCKQWVANEETAKSMLHQRDEIIKHFIEIYDAGALCFDCRDYKKACEKDFSECLECGIYELAIKAREVQS